MHSIFQTEDSVSANEQQKLPPQALTRGVAVILPVYRDVPMTQACIESALPDVIRKDAHLIVINDDSPDAGMDEMLASFAEKNSRSIRLLSNEKNLGFVKSVNSGIRARPDDDIVILNSDVVVPDQWLDRLTADAYSRPEIGTVTPLSNNATICGFPNFRQEEPPLHQLPIHILDLPFRRGGRLPCVPAPSGVGFCMYIRRDCLNDIGLLNEEKFGKGYGEENDLCQRAVGKGWINLISPNLFVIHEGGVSFSAEKQSRVEGAKKILDKLHPGYHIDVLKFISEDPLKAYRVARYIQLLSVIDTLKVLHVLHNMGGGVRQHVDELCDYTPSLHHLQLMPLKDNQVMLCLRDKPESDRIYFRLPQEFTLLKNILSAINLDAIHHHHVLGFDQLIQNLAEDLKIPRFITVHDYYWVNANPTLTDETGSFSQDWQYSKNPLYAIPNGYDFHSWQNLHRHFIENADVVIYPSLASKEIFETIYHPKNSTVVRHPEPNRNVEREVSKLVKKEQYVIGVIGAISREKGADLLESLAGYAKREAKIIIKLLGYAYRPLRDVIVLGPYENENIPELLKENNVDCIFFPAQWPETYSYTLSHALDSGLPIVAPNIGAFPERLEGRKSTLIFDHPAKAQDLCNQIVSFLTQLVESGQNYYGTMQAVKDYSENDFYSDEYLRLLNLGSKSKASAIAPIFDFQLENLAPGSADMPNGIRQKVLLFLWRLYSSKHLLIISNIIPFSFKRRIKRALSRQPIHDVVGRAGR